MADACICIPMDYDQADIAQVPEEGEDMDDISWTDPPTHPIEVL